MGAQERCQKSKNRGVAKHDLSSRQTNENPLNVQAKSEKLKQPNYEQINCYKCCIVHCALCAVHGIVH